MEEKRAVLIQEYLRNPKMKDGENYTLNFENIICENRKGIKTLFIYSYLYLGSLDERREAKVNEKGVGTKGMGSHGTFSTFHTIGH